MSDCHMKRALLFCLLLSCLMMTDAQQLSIRPALLKGSWPAHWISCPEVAQRAYGVYHFRKTFSLSTVPGNFIIHLSADNATDCT